MQSFINKIKGTSITAEELYQFFLKLELMSSEEIIAFWKTIQFTTETNIKGLDNNDKEKIAFLEKEIVRKAKTTMQKDGINFDSFVALVKERDKQRDFMGLTRLFGGNKFEIPLLPFLNE
jgi:SPX domain protein involved in polyphosphate accumulation